MRPVTRYLVWVHKWSDWTNYNDINGPTRTIYVVIMIRGTNRGQTLKHGSQYTLLRKLHHYYTYYWKLMLSVTKILVRIQKWSYRANFGRPNLVWPGQLWQPKLVWADQKWSGRKSIYYITCCKGCKTTHSISV